MSIAQASEQAPGEGGLAYRRVLLKVSGEALMGSKPFGIDIDTIDRIAGEIVEAKALGTQVALVIGGGNIFRGLTVAAHGMERASADYMGMLATVMNALAMQSALEKLGVDARVMSAIPIETICENYVRRKAMQHLERGYVVIFAAGTGNPFFTTDTAAALRAVETGCDALLKGTKVDGVYTADPVKNPDATRYETLSHMDVLSKDLRVMDASAISLARENELPVVVFSIHDQGQFVSVLKGEGRATVIR